MKKLDDIPKKNIFKVPDGYFEKLPMVIQSRVAEHSEAGWSWSWGFALKLAVPVFVVALTWIFWLKTGPEIPPVDVKSELAAIALDDLQQYIDQSEGLYESDLSTEELLDNPDWSDADVKQLENSVYSGYKASDDEIQEALDNEL